MGDLKQIHEESRPTLCLERTSIARIIVESAGLIGISSNSVVIRLIRKDDKKFSTLFIDDLRKRRDMFNAPLVRSLLWSHEKI